MTEPADETPHRHFIRLKGWDYSKEGWYFVTMVAFRRECLFGVIVDGEMEIHALRNIVQECWEAIPLHFPNVTMDAFVIMPNHAHGTIVIREEDDLPIVGGRPTAAAVPVGATHASP